MSLRGTGKASNEDSAIVNSDFTAVALKGFLDIDPRPTFVVAQNTNFDTRLEPIFSNASLRFNL